MKEVYYLERINKELILMIVLMLLLSDVIAETLVLGKKPELTQNFPINGVWNDLKYIGAIFFSRMLHWSNGYCIRTSSSDSG
jgi:hypothetical protein